jgi:hypothetical protein
LKTVMPPFEADPARAQALLDTVPVRYLIIGKDVVGTERYTVPVVRRFNDRWERVYSTPAGWAVYRRTDQRRVRAASTAGLAHRNTGAGLLGGERGRVF